MGILERIADWIRIKLIGPTLLEDIVLIPLGARLEDVIGQYGEAKKSKPCDDLPEAICYEFVISEYHEARAAYKRSRNSNSGPVET